MSELARLLLRLILAGAPEIRKLSQWERRPGKVSCKRRRIDSSPLHNPAADLRTSRSAQCWQRKYLVFSSPNAPACCRAMRSAKVLALCACFTFAACRVVGHGYRHLGQRRADATPTQCQTSYSSFLLGRGARQLVCVSCLRNARRRTSASLTMSAARLMLGASTA